MERPRDLGDIQFVYAQVHRNEARQHRTHSASAESVGELKISWQARRLLHALEFAQPQTIRDPRFTFRMSVRCKRREHLQLQKNPRESPRGGRWDGGENKLLHLKRNFKKFRRR